MQEFTIDGEQYVPFNGSLFRLTGEVDNIDELEDGQFYLHEDNVGTFEVEDVGYSAFDAIFVPKAHPDHKAYYTIGDTGNLGDDFTTARVLERLVPDHLVECPNCGAAAGEKDSPDTPTCFHCGYGTDNGVREEYA